MTTPTPTPPPAPRFRLYDHRRDDDSYMHSDTDYEWAVVSVETGDELARFHGRDFSGRQRGVETVALDLASHVIVATHYDGTVERVALPTRIAIIDDGRKIKLSYARGPARTRKRRACLFTMRSGQMYSPASLRDAPSDLA